MRDDEPSHLLAPDAAAPDGVVDAGDRPSAERVRALVGEGRPVLVRCRPRPDPAADAAETVALVAVYAWLGVRYFATGHPRQVRQALDMVASVQGHRPPAVARRGLA
ncbi:hypothetical protein [Marinitenerispora sediminis]|uniref:Uncharacterized protein n=1 Tax=Marinitenerispora sediminis TaxID=1931232 RepID=A0A368T3I9_9ACTN|nr:hypothetical protein [Marinitenerispora sediminis]RCV55851.1 hypothetical protein DEF28_04660 [Marinitenerispora sediminis]RCV56564.1 hypothetical protein DEF24_16515 [Marinitenerispora sediminis]RCV59402.1 hypothetical protein DEF23_07550 [Marinitenerispora sediminis]